MVARNSVMARRYRAAMAAVAVLVAAGLLGPLLAVQLLVLTCRIEPAAVVLCQVFPGTGRCAVTRRS